ALLQANRARKLVDRHSGKDRERRARTDSGDLDQETKRRPLLVGEEAEQDLGVLADDEVRQQRDALAGGGQVVEARHRNVDLVADAADVDEDLWRRLGG